MFINIGRFLKEEGSKVSVFVDKNNPEKVLKKTAIRAVNIFLIVICGFLIIITNQVIKNKKKEENNAGN